MRKKNLTIYPQANLSFIFVVSIPLLPGVAGKKYPPCGKYLQEMKLLKYISENNEIYKRCFIMIKINRVTHLKEWNHH